MKIFDDYLEAEDSLQENGVFINALSGKITHSDSYMTVVDFAALIKWKELYGVTEDVRLYWKNNYNQQPPLRLVAGFLRNV